MEQSVQPFFAQDRQMLQTQKWRWNDRTDCNGGTCGGDTRVFFETACSRVERDGNTGLFCGL